MPFKYFNKPNNTIFSNLINYIKVFKKNFNGNFKNDFEKVILNLFFLFNLITIILFTLVINFFFIFLTASRMPIILSITFSSYGIFRSFISFYIQFPSIRLINNQIAKSFLENEHIMFLHVIFFYYFVKFYNFTQYLVALNKF